MTIALRLSLLATVLDLGWNKALNAADHDDTTIRAREPAELAWRVKQSRMAFDLGLLCSGQRQGTSPGRTYRSTVLDAVQVGDALQNARTEHRSGS